MITTLNIKNIGIIEELNIDFNQGLNVLTGETGAGKTLIIDSLQVISGGRFSKEMIRRGETYSFVEICIYDPKNEKSIDGNIIVSREIHLSGKNMCKINGRMVTVHELKEFMNTFIEIHGQHDNQNLLNPKLHLNYLDNFIGEEIFEIRNKYIEEYKKYLKICKDLKENYGDEKEKQRRIDLLKYQIEEIKSASLKKDEENSLEEKRKIMLNSEKIFQNINSADEIISSNLIEGMSQSIRYLEKIESIDDKFSGLNTNLKNIYYELQEISRDMSSYIDDIDFNEEERDFVEERLDIINSLKRKYGNSIEEILEYKLEVEAEVNHIENLEAYIKELKNKKMSSEKEMDILASKINNIRTKYAKILSEKINNELVELEMKNAKINVKVEYLENSYLDTGKNRVELYITTNKGEEEKSLVKIASGGEMSRTMLAIKKVLADIDEIPIMIFDEIDTGISGKAANSVANKLSEISKKHQVMCISHLPNIAAIADYNYFISKKVLDDRTKTEVKLLKEEEVINEIARISYGEVNDISKKYANELRNKKVS